MPSDNVRNLGVQFDSTLSLQKHVRTVCKAAFFHINRIWKIRKYLNRSATQALVHAHVLSRLDYCNSLLYGAPACLIQRLQRVQNAAARLVSKAKRMDHATPLLKELHWLPIKTRLEFKIQVMAFKIVKGQAPPYLCELLAPYEPVRALRSCDQNLLNMPSFRLQTFGGRAFSVTAPRLWNQLPLHLKNCDNVDNFKKKLKTFHFNNAFN